MVFIAVLRVCASLLAGANRFLRATLWLPNASTIHLAALDRGNKGIRTGKKSSPRDQIVDPAPWSGIYWAGAQVQHVTPSDAPCSAIAPMP